MPTTPTASQLIDTVLRSPAAVAAHDRRAWVGLFTEDGVVNDPVGSRPHHGHAAIGRFYDTFIAPNGIEFQPGTDIVCGMTVFRDLSLRTTMPNGVSLLVPMHLRYDLAYENDVLRIRRLCAHWELIPMVRQLLGSGPKGMTGSLKLGGTLLAHQRIWGTLGFLEGVRGVGATGKKAASSFLEATAHGNVAAAERFLTPESVLELPAGHPLTVDEFTDQVHDLTWRKIIAAGPFVTASVRHESTDAVALLRCGADGTMIDRVQLFIDR